MAKLRAEKKSHRRAQTAARDEERDDLAPSKHSYPRDKVWEWRRSEEEDEETSSSDDQGGPFDSLLGLPRRGAAAMEGRGAQGQSLGRGGRRGRRGRGGRGGRGSRGHASTSGYIDSYSQSDSDVSETQQLREYVESDSSNSSVGV